MCEFCIKHGEGKKWYEVMQNYSQELYAQGNREQFVKDFLANFEHSYKYYEHFKRAKKKTPLAFRFISKMASWRMKQHHFGQVVPIEDVEMIIDMVQSVTRVPCVCRGVTRNSSNARYCFALGIDPSGWLGDFPDLKANLETLTPKEAKVLIKQFDKEGLVHSIWTFKTPFIGALCNCDHDCMAYKLQVSAELMQIMFKGEYVADIDPDHCVGCRGCQKLCQFGAVEYSSFLKKCLINAHKCYGCGVCRSVCHQEAITLLDRNQVPELAGVW